VPLERTFRDASDEARFVAGTVLTIDGGFTA